MIQLKNINKSFSSYSSFFSKKDNEYKVLSNINIEIKNNEIFGIIGKNGIGKSTLLKIIFGSITPDSGEILFNGCEKKFLSHQKKFSLINNNDRSFFWRLTVEENLKYFSSLYKEDNNEVSDRIREHLMIDDLMKKNFYSLSSGQKKKIMLYRGLLKNPEVIFFDEFTQSLDLPSKTEVERIILDLKQKYKKTIIWITHDMNEIFDLCNSMALMEKEVISQIDIEREDIDLKNRIIRSFHDVKK